MKHLHILNTVTFSLACTPHEGKCWICAQPLLRAGVFSLLCISLKLCRVEILAMEKSLASMKAEANLETINFSCFWNNELY